MDNIMNKIIETVKKGMHEWFDGSVSNIEALFWNLLFFGFGILYGVSEMITFISHHPETLDFLK